jgi:2-oxoglutarate ferredoxin oxidoreductase subunit beta
MTMATKVQRNPKDYEGLKPVWCPGCGDFGVLNALKKVLADLDLDPKDIALVTGIGCSSQISSFLKAYAFHGVHGRLLPVATAIKLMNPRLTVIGAGGDGDGYAIGLSHFLHAVRRNVDITYIVMNNQVYGLTKGQASPTAAPGFVTSSTPQGTKERDVDGVKLALAAGVTFVARGFSGDVPQLVKLFKEAILHPGFALVDVLSPCVTYNRVNTYDWFRENIINLDEDPEYDPTDRVRVLAKIMTLDRIPTGLIFKDPSSKPYSRLVLKDPDSPPALEDLRVRPELAELQEQFV